MADDNILSKLFDTLRHASDRNEEATQKLIVQQLELVSHIKNMPVRELKSALESHAKDSKEDIDECSGTVVTKSEDIMEFLRQINNKITKMLITLAVVIAVSTGGYFIIRYAAETNGPPESWEEKLRDIEKQNHEEMMKAIREEIRKLHPELRDEPIHK